VKSYEKIVCQTHNSQTKQKSKLGIIFILDNHFLKLNIEDISWLIFD